MELILRRQRSQLFVDSATTAAPANESAAETESVLGLGNDQKNKAMTLMKIPSFLIVKISNK